MNKKSQIKQIAEGATDFFVFKEKTTKKGPGKKNKFPFYNPSMELNRDLSVLICQWIVNNRNKTVHLLDGLAATGARGLRIKNEVEGNFDITINDWDKDAYELINQNVKYNKLKNVEVLNQNLNILLSEKKYD